MQILTLFSISFAGTGPWLPGPGQLQVYLGVEGQQFTTIKAYGMPSGIEDVEIGGGIVSLSGVADLTYGVGSRTSVEIIVPYQHAHANRPEAEPCPTFDLGACETTDSFGVIEAQVKHLLLDEVAGAPVSLSVGGVVRFGGLTSADRGRFTNAGEGTTDLGLRVSMGRSGGLGAGYWVGSLDMEALYRSANTDVYPFLTGTQRVPAHQFGASADLLAAPRTGWAFGPTASVAGRPRGLDVGEMLGTGLLDVDRFAAIRFLQARGGAKLILQDKTYNSISISVVRTFFAINNPRDTLAIGVGLSLNNLSKRKG